MRAGPLAGGLRARPRKPSIGLTPLIDLVFILVVFFMLATRLDRPESVPVVPASESAGEVAEGAVLLRLEADGRLRLGARYLPLDRLDEALADRRSESPVLLAPAEAAPVQALVTTLERLEALAPGRVRVVR